MKFCFVQEKVKKILTRYPETRSDDFKLISHYLFENCDELPVDVRLYTALENHNKYDIPSFESITRARRKVQVKYPELAPNETVKEFRKEQENEFRSYYK